METGYLVSHTLLTLTMLASFALGLLIGLIVGAIQVISIFTKRLAEQVVRVQIVPVVESKRGGKLAKASVPCDSA